MIEEIQKLKYLSFKEGEKKLIELHRKAQIELGYDSPLQLYETIFVGEGSEDRVQAKFEKEVDDVILEVKKRSEAL